VKPWERRAFNLLALAVAASGFAYFWMKYFIQNDDPFAVLNHPWQSTMLTLHLLASPPFVLVFGIILNSHIMKKLRAPRMPNRTSGLLSFGTFAAMVASGYLLQVTMDDRWLQALVALHVTSGALFVGAYAVHLVISTRLLRRRAPAGAIREVA
jgi:hypothetical protein